LGSSGGACFVSAGFSSVTAGGAAGATFGVISSSFFGGRSGLGSVFFFRSFLVGEAASTAGASGAAGFDSLRDRLLELDRDRFDVFPFYLASSFPSSPFFSASDLRFDLRSSLPSSCFLSSASDFFFDRLPCLDPESDFLLEDESFALASSSGFG
jgi:hypothetical protein